jgi:hypothetical protein
LIEIYHLQVKESAQDIVAILSSRNRHGRLKRITLRIACGARLRRAMRGRDYPARLKAIAL